MRLNTPIRTLSVRDVTGQRHVRVHDIPLDYTVGEVIDGILPRMELNRLDSGGAPVAFEARLEREGRQLNRTEKVGDSLVEDDEMVLLPRITAGAH